jgi:hypothetical protein
VIHSFEISDIFYYKIDHTIQGWDAMFHHDIHVAEILQMLALSTNQCINQSFSEIFISVFQTGMVGYPESLTHLLLQN